MRHVQYAVVALIGMLAVSAHTLPVYAEEPARAAVDDSEAEKIRAMASLFIENRNAPRQLTCRYELRYFASGQLEDIFLDRLVPDSRADGLLVRDEDLTRREVNISDADLAKALRENNAAFDTRHELLKGERGLYYARDIKGAVLFSSSYPPRDTVIGPFSLGHFSGRDNQQNVSLILEQPDQVASAHVLQPPYPAVEHAAVAVNDLLGIEYLDARGVRLQFYVAPQHGGIPIVAHKYSGDTLFELAVVTDIRQLEDGHFFPMRTVFSSVKDGNAAQTSGAIETRVVELKVNEPVDPSLFQMQLEAGSVMRDGMNFKSQFHVDNARTVTLDDLDDLFAQAAAAAVQRAEWDRLNEQNAVSAVSAMPQPRTVGLSLLVYATAILVVIAVAVLLLKRYLRQRH